LAVGLLGGPVAPPSPHSYSTVASYGQGAWIIGTHAALTWTFTQCNRTVPTMRLCSYLLFISSLTSPIHIQRMWQKYIAMWGNCNAHSSKLLCN